LWKWSETHRFFSDNFQFWWPVFYMMQIDSAQVFNLKVVVWHSLFLLVPRLLISFVWEQRFKEMKWPYSKTIWFSKYMIQIDSHQVFNIKVLECHAFFWKIPRSRIALAWAASFEKRK
jgi:hypothetical protein